MYLIRNVRMSDIKMRHITLNFSLLMQETSTSSNTLMHFLRTHTKKNPLNAIVLLFNQCFPSSPLRTITQFSPILPAKFIQYIIPTMVLYVSSILGQIYYL